MTATVTEDQATTDTRPGDLDAVELSAVLDAHAVIARVCETAAHRELSADLPLLQAEVTEAESRTAQALSETRPYQAVVTRWQDEVSACEQRRREVQAASDGYDLEARLQARAMRIAVTEELAELHQRLQTAHRDADPSANRLLEAQQAEKAARARLASLEHAIAEPWLSDRGRRTGAYRTLLINTGLFMADDHPSPEARAITMGFLARSGIGADLERRAIAAYIAGDPAARNAGDTKTWPDGQSLIRSKDGPPIVMNGRAAPGDLDAAPPVPAGPGPSGADVAGGFRSGVDWPQAQPSVNKADGDGWVPGPIRRLGVG